MTAETVLSSAPFTATQGSAGANVVVQRRKLDSKALTHGLKAVRDSAKSDKNRMERLKLQLACAAVARQSRHSKKSSALRTMLASLCFDGSTNDQLVEASNFASVVASASAIAKTSAAFVGEWSNTSTNNLEPYLKSIGVSWAKRKIAVAFKPVLTFDFDQSGVLQVRMPSPIGERVEIFPMNAEVPVSDPLGRQFVRVASWDGDVLQCVARDPTGKIADFVTRRRVRADGLLEQVTVHADVQFERLFVRKHGALET